MTRTAVSLFRAVALLFGRVRVGSAQVNRQQDREPVLLAVSRNEK